MCLPGLLTKPLLYSRNTSRKSKDAKGKGDKNEHLFKFHLVVLVDNIKQKIAYHMNIV